MTITVLLGLWAFALLVLFTDPKRTSTRFGSATAFIGGFGFFSAVIDDELYPVLQNVALQHPLLDTFIGIASRSSSFLCQAGMPYTFLMFAIHSSDFLSRRVKRIVTYAALVPPLVMLAITPVYPVLQFNYRIMLIWVIPYFLCSCLLLIYLHWVEKDPILKKSRLINNVLTIVPLLFVFTSIYVMRTLQNYEAWRYNVWIVGLQFVLFVAISVKYDLLGVKLRVEKRRLNSTLRAMTSGAAIMNHTIKNELGKITLFADRIESYAAPDKQQEMKADMQILLQSTQNVLNMVNRIQGQIQDIALKEELTQVSSVVDRVLHDLQPYIAKTNVTIQTDVADNIQLKCDPVHLREVLTNLCMNALEAMKSGGTLSLDMYDSGKYLILSVTDTGTGIAKENLPYVLDPFFSTKKHGQNFGLGLSYCYNVMQKHHGMLEIRSTAGQGTAVYLYFPQKRVQRTGHDS